MQSVGPHAHLLMNVFSPLGPFNMAKCQIISRIFQQYSNDQYIPIFIAKSMSCITKFNAVRNKQQQRAPPRLCSNCFLWFQSKEQGTRVKERAKNVTLVPFFVRPKPKIPFVGLSLLRNQTETLATQAKHHIMSLVSSQFSEPGTDRLVCACNSSIYLVQHFMAASGPRGGGYLRNFWLGMCRWDPGTLNLYQS